MNCHVRRNDRASLPAVQDYFKAVPNSEYLVRLALTLPALFIALGVPKKRSLYNVSAPDDRKSFVGLPKLSVTAVFWSYTALIARGEMVVT
jgi:hypothetical protein